MNQKVSIIIPMYNASSRIIECLESIKNQTYKNLEVIIVDDGSKDDSYDKASNFVKDDDRFIIYQQENGGVSKARNFGLEHVHGDYIQFVDSDDTLEPEMVETLLTLNIENDCELSICNNSIHPFTESHLPDKVFNLKDQEDFLEFYQQIFAPLCPWNKMWKKEVLDGIKFDENIMFTEDELFACGSYPNVNRAVSTSKRLYNYYWAPVGKDEGVVERTIKKIIMGVMVPSDLYFMTYKVIPGRVAVFEEAIKNKKIPFTNVEDIAYYRAFDILFLDWSTFIAVNIPEQVLVRELDKIVRREEFNHSLRLSEKLGFSFYKAGDKDYNARIVACNALMTASVREAMKNKGVTIPILVAITAFTYVMMKKSSQPVVSKNMTNRLYHELIENETPISKLVNKHIKNLHIDEVLSKIEAKETTTNFELYSQLTE